MRLGDLLFTAILVVVFFTGSFSQDLPKDKVIRSNGQVVEGKAILDFELEDLETLEFETSDGTHITLDPSSISEIHFGSGRRFVALDIDQNGDLEFVSLLFSGQWDLVRYQRNYFLKEGSQLIPLKELKSTREQDGRTVQVVTPQYRGVLLSTLQVGPDQMELKSKIDRVRLSDRELVEILEIYHSGRNLSHQQFIPKGKSMETGIRVMAGVGMQSLIKNFENQGFEYGFASSTAPYFEAGVRFRNFKSAPRVMVDLGVGIYLEPKEIEVAAQRITFELSGSQQIKTSSVVVPVAINYILKKTASSSIYAGAGLTFWVSSFANESASVFIDNGGSESNTNEENFVSRKSSSLSPSLKLGWMRDFTSGSLIIELKGDLVMKNYEFFPLNYYSVYHLGVGTISVGYQF
jgi:hypothetical protein